MLILEGAEERVVRDVLEELIGGDSVQRSTARRARWLHYRLDKQRRRMQEHNDRYAEEYRQ